MRAGVFLGSFRVSEFPRTGYAGKPFAYAPALLLQYSAYSCRMWTTLNKLLYAPLHYPKSKPYIHPPE